MKQINKALSLMLAMAMLFTLAVTAFAAEEELGSITINGVSADNTYEIYRLLDLESYKKGDLADPDNPASAGVYSYKVNTAWTGFFATGSDALKFFTIENGYVTWTWTDSNKEDDYTETDAVADFAKLALTHAKANGIAPVQSSKNDGEFVVTGTTGKFSDLPLGYYLVDSTMGALCGLTTTNPDASINAKNGTPTIDKQVQEDSTNQWGDNNTADVGQIVEFRTTINVHAGAQNYVLHDTMSDGLTFEHDTTKELIYSGLPETDIRKDAFRGVWRIEHIVPGISTHTVEDKYFTIVTDVPEDLEDGCTFEVRFTEEFCNHLETNDKIIVYYNAMLNREAVIAGEGNSNEAWLDFGENNHTNHDTTQTYTFGIDIVKTDSQNTLLDGAEFKIYDAATNGNEIAVVLMDDGVTYRRARADETGVSIVVKDGQVRVVGFDNGTYYLEETKAPTGYNKLTARQRFIISDSNFDAIFNDGIYSTGSGVHVVNKGGTMLPETGGMGTKMFITFGAVVVLGAGALLVTKKRMGMIED